MSAQEADRVDQALFGYADGHRLIAGSTKLPSRDLYQVSAASDLASGVTLKAGDSYLTGLPLGVSKRYALIRTWPATEMPRPGCVWSHALIIDFRTLSARADLSDFLALFRSPTENDTRLYSRPLEVPPINQSSETGPDEGTIRTALSFYYNMKPAVLAPLKQASKLEASILAIWSQQWPKLRITFTFRSAVGGDRRRSETTAFDIRVSNFPEPIVPDEPVPLHGHWLSLAVEDAMASGVTQLRRFLWRYGRDLTMPRKSFSQLVETYSQVASNSKLSIETAQSIFAAFPDPHDAVALKRDALGIGGATVPLIPPLSLPDFLEIVARGNGVEITGPDIASRISHMEIPDIAPISQLIETDKSPLPQWLEALYAQFASVSDRSVVVDHRISAKVRDAILRARPDLLDKDVAEGLSDGALKELVILHGDGEITRRIAEAVVTRDYGYETEKLLFAAPVDLTCSAIGITLQGRVKHSWALAISRNSYRLPIQNILSKLQTTADMATAVGLIRLSPRAGPGSREWSSFLELSDDNVSGDARIVFYAFLLLVALCQESETSWKVIIRSLPEVRDAVTQGRLPRLAYTYLDNELPRFYTAHYWDLNKRILLAIAMLRRRYPFSGASAELNLNSEDAHVLEYGLGEEDERSRKRFWFF